MKHRAPRADFLAVALSALLLAAGAFVLAPSAHAQVETPLDRALNNHCSNVQHFKTYANSRADPASDVKVIKSLLDAGSDPNAVSMHGNPLLYSACTAEVIKMLLDAGADPNAKDKNGNTMLLLWVNDAEVIKLLLDAGAKVNTKGGR